MYIKCFELRSIENQNCMRLFVKLILYGSKIIQMNFYNFEKFGPFHTFLPISKINIPLKVPHLEPLRWVTFVKNYG